MRFGAKKEFVDGVHVVVAQNSKCEFNAKTASIGPRPDQFLSLCGKTLVSSVREGRFSGGIGFAHAQMPELLRGRMGDPGRVIIGKWSTSRLTSQNLIQRVKKRAKRNGTTPDRQARSRTRTRRKGLKTSYE
jgi:hypothetical protein